MFREFFFVFTIIKPFFCVPLSDGIIIFRDDSLTDEIRGEYAEFFAYQSSLFWTLIGQVIVTVRMKDYLYYPSSYGHG